MNIPDCPNSLEQKCERSDLRLHGENETSFLFVCHTCTLLWSVSKKKTQSGARWHNQLRKVKQLTDLERERQALPKNFYVPRTFNGIYS